MIAWDPNEEEDRPFRVETPEGLWDYYYAAVGRLMHNFARCEDSLTAEVSSFVLAVVGMPPRPGFDVLRALTAGMRMTAARDSLKRYLKMTNAPDFVLLELTAIFRQLGEVQFLRDRIAHYAAYPDSQARSQWFTCRPTIPRDNLADQTIRFTPAMVLAAAEDLDCLPNRISWALMPLRRKVDQDRYLPEEEKPLRAPWKYKPAQLVRPGQGL